MAEKTQITDMGSFGKSEKGEVSKRGQGAQDAHLAAEAEAEKAKKKGGKDE